MFSACPFVLLSVHCLTCERDILKMNEPMLMLVWMRYARQGREAINFGGQEVKGQNRSQKSLSVIIMSK